MLASFSDIALGLLIGFGIDLALGWPTWLYQRIGHPVGWLAAPVAAFERRVNGPDMANRTRFAAGSFTTLTAIGVSAGLWQAMALAAAQTPIAAVLYGILFWPLIAARSMYIHVAAIARPLQDGDLEGARHAVSMIVGRDPSRLDEAGVARAALESLSENTSDGIVAPLFWGLVFGPAGMAGYKAINTLDSMIAHRSARYEWFGKLAARIDDLANLAPARLTGVIYALVSGRAAGRALRLMWRDAGRHRSPNAGWPESAMAAALDVRLSGPRVYADRIAHEPWLNEGAKDPDASAIAQGLRLYLRLLAVCITAIGAGALWLHLAT